MTLLPKIKLKALVSFPATILDGTGIDVVKANGTYTFNIAYDDFAPPVAGLSDPVNQNVLVWNSATGRYDLVPVSGFVGATISPATATPLIEAGIGSVGTGVKYAREDHSHPAFSSGGSGDVVGPASAVDSNLAAFNTTTGKLIKDSGVALAAASGAVRYDTAQGLSAPQQVQGRSNIGAGIAPTTIANSLGADVTLNNTANYFDGPSVAQGTSGTWFASGTVTFVDTAGAAQFYGKLWDGTTVIATAVMRTDVASATYCLSLSGVIASPSGNIRISVRDATATTGKIIFNTTGLSKDSTLTAVRIA